MVVVGVVVGVGLRLGAGGWMGVVAVVVVAVGVREWRLAALLVCLVSKLGNSGMCRWSSRMFGLAPRLLWSCSSGLIAMTSVTVGLEDGICKKLCLHACVACKVPAGIDILRVAVSKVEATMPSDLLLCWLVVSCGV